MYLIELLNKFLFLCTFINNNFLLQFDRAVRLFGEDNSTIQPDDFFAIFDSFLTALSEASQDNTNVKKRRDEEEKRSRQEVEVRNL